ncbi:MULTISPECIES: hypothetical protein [Gilvimarinus]|uniref:hypothetical protein n=1 Tax=Gilvimarinus TaxID=940550 RepID=UPI0003607B9F|nr:MULTISPECIES: hypothetical protein [Gilvimarinus]UTF61231.1 hypothetical protein NHM04_05370 [Gilvimarinus sp. DA14]
MTKGNDFFFGEYSTLDGIPSFSLITLCKLAGRVPSRFFTDCLNRFLLENNNALLAQDGSTESSISELVGKLDSDGIGSVHIYERLDGNQCVKGELGCDLILANGVLSIHGFWTTNSEQHASIAVNNLLVPLYLKGLSNRIHLRQDENMLVPLTTGTSKIHRNEILNIFRLLEYGDGVYRGSEKNRQKLDEHARQLDICRLISEKNLSWVESQNLYRKEVGMYL